MSYVRVSILGATGSEEVWSINPVFDPTGEFPGGVDQGLLDATALVIANRTVPTTLRQAMSTAMTRTGCRLEVRDDATDDLIAIATQASTTPSAGTGTVFLPPQSAQVISVRTNTPGASGRGRLYWPAMGVSINATGRIVTPVPATFIADAKSFLLGIRSDLAAGFPTIGFDLAVRSRTTHTTPHAVRIQAGNIVDTQRRRRDSLPESYSSVAFP